MKEMVRRSREISIFEAAYEQLKLYGYGGASMLRIANAAKASNETLYRWFGDKDGLFKAMVKENAAQTYHTLKEAIDQHQDAWQTLVNIAPILLRMILSEKAILLNRAAAADPSGALGLAISTSGRGEIKALLNQLIKRICTDESHNEIEVTEWFLSLLVGDLQTLRIINQQAELSDIEIEIRCLKTLAALRCLLNDKAKIA
ncbi:TetR/AcrR family transcriptional regulator [Bartonella sp. HY329]|uniref:TetR/AcrR family transcriptional regulator n=1 Tax=unclassified Bartonella TaxID=2645622 RepID=UPI0021C72BB4|nr:MULTISPECIES: TetR/AcrR family transcriptional regulator [unclassified Bartonella]UXM95721.1 TetR/AcrR family transcriptional regulator [Bartonella sp. HY329]UXN10046.1 TetR/AcrR family transcriptional regulator [Bartonella sp. HY328]